MLHLQAIVVLDDSPSMVYAARVLYKLLMYVEHLKKNG